MSLHWTAFTIAFSFILSSPTLTEAAIEVGAQTVHRQHPSSGVHEFVDPSWDECQFRVDGNGGGVECHARTIRDTKCGPTGRKHLTSWG